MITEKGTIAAATKIDGKATKELNKSSLILGILYTVIGAIALLISGIVLIYDVFLSESGKITTSYYMPLCVGVFLIAAGIVLLVAYNTALKSSTRFNRVEELEFFSDYFLARQYTNGELTSVDKVYYGWIFKRKETAHYIFLYLTPAAAFYVDKNTLPLNELAAVRGLITKTTTTAPQPATAYVPGNTVYTQEPSVPQDPFAEFAQSVSPAPAKPAELPPEPEKSETDNK